MAWERRLEACAYATLFLSLIASIGTAPSYNTAVALLALFAHHTRRGRHVLAAVCAQLASLAPDAVALSTLNSHEKLDVVPYMLVPAAMLAKLLGAAAAYGLFVSLGGTWSLSESAVPAEAGGSRTPSASDTSGVPRTFSEVDTPLTAGFYSPAAGGQR
jgi:hypothetical protein